MRGSANAYEEVVSSSPPSSTTVGDPLPVHLTYRPRSPSMLTTRSRACDAAAVDASASTASPPQAARRRPHAATAVSATADALCPAIVARAVRAPSRCAATPKVPPLL